MKNDVQYMNRGLDIVIDNSDLDETILLISNQIEIK